MKSENEGKLKKTLPIFSNKFLLIIALLTIASPIQSQGCGNGCLRCTKNNICLLCDNQLFYVRSGYTCIQNIIPNCNSTSTGLDCQVCIKNYYYNTTVGACLPVVNLRNNCFQYDTTAHCQQCNNTNLYVDVNGNCSPITNVVNNCAVHYAKGLCQRCMYPFILSNDNTTCSSVPLTLNCLLYSGALQCQQCQPGFALQRNKYISDLKINYTFLLSFYKEVLLQPMFNTTVAMNSTNVCSLQVTNCAVVSPYNNCTTCMSGFFNNNGDCMQNPIQSIPFCRTYSQQNRCIECRQLYFLNNSMCSKVTNITFCITYDTFSNLNCLECSDEYYSAGSTCEVRQKLINNCLKLQENADRCKTCQQGYGLTPDNLACLYNIQFCQSPAFLAAPGGGFTATCVQCINQFFVSTVITNGLISTSCLLPIQLIQGCLVYQQANLCIQCDSGYYLSNFNCRTHDSLVQSMIICQNYSTAQSNLCINCQPGQYLFKLQNYCNPVPTLLLNCMTYNTNALCSQCTPMYYLTVDTQKNLFCQLTNITNCIQVDISTNTCLQCDPQTATMPNNAFRNNMCATIPLSFSASCNSFVVNIFNSIANCNSCFIPYYPWQMNSIYFQYCYPLTEIQNIGTGINGLTITNLGTCMSFDLSLQACLMCDPASITPMIASKAPGNCVSGCNWGDEVVLTFSFNGSNPSSFFQCMQVSLIHMFGDSSTNCQRADYDVSVVIFTPGENLINQYCAQCLPLNIPIVYSYSTNFYTHYDYLPLSSFNNQISSNSYFSPLNKVPIYQNCKSWTTTFMTNNAISWTYSNHLDSSLNPLGSYSANSIYFVLNWQNFQNCDSLIGEMQTSGFYSYGCSSCGFQYTGPAITSAAGTNFIYNCIQMTTCNTNIYYQGIGSHDINAQMYLFVSCHVCTDTTKIVTVTSVIPWTFPLDPSKALNFGFPTTGYYPVNTCYIPGMISTNQLVFPANCTIQQIVPLQVFQPYTPTLSIPPNPACVACAPMTVPTLSGSNLSGQRYQYITKCTLISNCQSSNTFNACDVCNPGFVILASTTAPGNTTGSACVANNILGCQAGFLNGLCVICQSGYTLNVYGFCDSIIMPKCTAFGNLTPYNTAYLYLSTNPFPQGCRVCAAGTYSVRFPYPVTLCIYSNSLATTTIFPNFYIPNCLYYSLNSQNQLICTVCATGYSPTNTNSTCIKINTIQNCLIYASSTTPAIPVCFQCNNQYYLKNNACFPGVIKNCLVYINFQNCQTCAPGMVATKIAFSLYIVCFDVSQSLVNCTSFDLNSAFNGYLNCVTCNPNNYLVSFGVPISTCSNFSSIPNCLTYDIQANFFKTSFFCLLCQPAYYVILKQFPSICLLRLNYPIAYCMQHDPNNDYCNSCISGFYKSPSNLICTQNPNGIQGCRIYQNVTYCLECNGVSGFYATGGVCLTLSPRLAVVNCYTYNAQSICTSCIPGYQYLNGVCNLVTIQNCHTIGLGNLCLVCANSYTLIAGACAISTLTNCQVFQSATMCSVCQSGFYLNAGRCLVPFNIPFCVIYSSPNQCNQCQNQAILETNLTVCTILSGSLAVYTNPSCYQYIRTPICIYCNVGYYFDPISGICVACQTTPSKSCAICDYLNPTVCLICSSGYFMNANTTCSLNQEIVVVKTKIDDPNMDFYSDVQILKILWFFILGVFFFLKQGI